MDQSPAPAAGGSIIASKRRNRDIEGRPSVAYLVTAHYKKSASGVLTLARRWGTAEDAEDILQESAARFIAAARKRQIEAPAAFFARVAANIVKDHLKSGAARMARRAVPSHEVEGLTDPDDPYRTIAAREEWSLCRQRLNDLPELTLKILLMHRLDGITYSAIADQLELPRWLIQKHMSQARALLDHHRNSADADFPSRISHPDEDWNS